MSSKKEHLECTDLSLVSPSPETTSVVTDSELRLRGKRPAVDNQIEQSKRSCAGKLSVAPWSAPSGEKRKLEVEEETQPKKQCVSERESPLLEENEEILWCEMLNSEEEFNDENEVNDDHAVAEMEQLVQGAARKGNERGANVYEKSLIWAAKDTEWKKLEEKGAVHILSGDSCKQNTQFGDRFIPRRCVVNRPNSVSNCVSVGTHSIVSNDCEQRLELAAGRYSWCFLGSRSSGQETRIVVLQPPSRRIPGYRMMQ